MRGKVTRITTSGARREGSTSKANVLNAAAGFLNASSGILGVSVLVGLGVLVYLFSGFLGSLVSVVLQMIGAMLLTVLTICYVGEGAPQMRPTEEEVASGMSVKTYLINKHRKSMLEAKKYFKKEVSESLTDVEVGAAYRQKEVVGAALYTVLGVLMITYAVYGFGTGLLRVPAIVATIVVALGKLGLYLSFDSNEKAVQPARVKHHVIRLILYGVPPIYTAVILLTYVL